MNNLPIIGAIVFGVIILIAFVGVIIQSVKLNKKK